MARKVHPRRKRHDEEAEDDGNRGDGWSRGVGPCDHQSDVPGEGPEDEIPPKTVENVGGETDQEAPSGETEAET